MAEPKPPVIPSVAGYTCLVDGSFIFTPKQMGQFIERLRWVALQEKKDK